MRAAALASLALIAAVAGSGATAWAQLPSGRGVLLPLQDRVGEAKLAALTETLLRQELEARADLVESVNVRAVLRSMRVRDASYESLDRLAVLAERLEVEWFFLATLHEARAGRKPQRQDGGSTDSQRIEDSGDTPQVVLSARVLRSDSPELWWSGFDGASGRDRERVFGLGDVETLGELMQDTVKGLVARAAEPREARKRTRLRPREGGYLRSGFGPSPPERVAVIPLDSVASRDPSASAEVATAALLTTLGDFGFNVLLPGLVQSIRQESGQIQYGGASRAEWEALAREGGARWIATGTVETYGRGQGRTPDPRVAFSLRFLDTSDGRIDWSNGLARTGKDTASVFGRGRIYSTGALTYAMMQSLIGELRVESRLAKTPRGN